MWSLTRACLDSAKAFTAAIKAIEELNIFLCVFLIFVCLEVPSDNFGAQSWICAVASLVAPLRIAALYGGMSEQMMHYFKILLMIQAQIKAVRCMCLRSYWEKHLVVPNYLPTTVTTEAYFALKNILLHQEICFLPWAVNPRIRPAPRRLVQSCCTQNQHIARDDVLVCMIVFRCATAAASGAPVAIWHKFSWNNFFSILKARCESMYQAKG